MEKFASGLADDAKKILKDYAKKIGEQFVNGARNEKNVDVLDDGSIGDKFYSPPERAEQENETAIVSMETWASRLEEFGTRDDQVISYDFGRIDTAVNRDAILLEQPAPPYDPRKPHPNSSPSRGRKTLAANRRFSASPTEMMLASGPDWMSNAFDCFFVFVPKEGYKPKGGFDDFDSARIPTWATPYERQVLSHKGFAVRVGRVSLSYAYNDSYSVPFLESTVEKIRSTKVVKMESSFTLRLDDNLVWLDHVQALAGRYGVLDDYVAEPTVDSQNAFVASLEAGGSNLDQDSYRKLFKTIAASWSTTPIRKNNPEKDAIRSFELCLVVKMQRLHGLSNKLAQELVLPYFVFENIKVLGVQGDIEYSTEPGQQEPVVPFIFRRCYQIAPGLGTVRYDGPVPDVQSWSRTTNFLDPPKYSIPSSIGDDRLLRTRLPEYFSEQYSPTWSSTSPSIEAEIAGEEP